MILQLVGKALFFLGVFKHPSILFFPISWRGSYAQSQRAQGEESGVLSSLNVLGAGTREKVLKMI